ncbi:MAG: polysaccharide biosynthesis tyrosine autokinase [Planctomycetes bacterium]|nr:polysaccharide biosynthesis tyrosine autokinase [Planctomycetota bacterium]
MTGDDIENTAASSAPGAQAHPVADFVGILRAHALWGFVVAAVVFFVMMRSAVGKPDAYQSAGLLQLSVPEPRSSQDLLATMLAMDGRKETAADLLTLQSRTLAREAVRAGGSTVRAYLEPVRERSWSEWWQAFRGHHGTAVHVRARVRKAPGHSVSGTVRLVSRGDEQWEAVPVSGFENPTALPFRFAEPWSDINGNGERDDAERYADANGNGRFDPPEEFLDVNGDGTCNRMEPFDDLDGDGRCDRAESFIDVNGNGVFDEGEVFDDRDRDGHRDVNEAFVDLDGDGFRRAYDEPWTDANGNREWDPGETFEDRDGDERYSPAEPFEDLDGDGVWDAGQPLVWGDAELDLYWGAGDPDGLAFAIHVLSEDDAISRLVGALEASEVTEYSGVATVRAVHGDPYQARDMVQAILQAFVVRKYEGRLERTNRLLDWLRGELAVATRRLATGYRLRDQFVRGEGAVLLEERAAAAYEEKGALTRERLQIEFELRRIDDERQVLAADRSALEALRSVPADQVDAQTATLLAERTRLLMELGRLGRHGHGTGSLEFDDTKARLNEVEPLLEAASSKLVRERLAALDIERGRLQGRYREAIAREKAQNDLLGDLPRLEQGLVELMRPIEQYERIVQELARSQSGAEMARASTSQPAQILENASLQPGPVAPNRLLELALALVAALGAGMGACWLREHLDHRVRNARQVERSVGRPLAGAVPAFHTVRRRERARRAHALVALHNEPGLLAETYRKLRASIRHEHRNDPIRTLAITSPTQGEGKSLTTMNLAVTMAQAGERVLVIDGDLRRPSVHRLAGTSREPGISDVLGGRLGWQEAVVEGPTSGLFVLPAGGGGDRAAVALESAAMTTLLTEASAAYDCVLVDVPPVLAVSDALAFFHHLDAVFLLVRAGRYSVDVPREAAELIERAGGRLRGVILNAFDARLAARRGGAYYGYRYGARYAYR